MLPVQIGGFVLVMIVAFIAMEPATAATHRWIMHGIGEWLHRSHHRARPTAGWERNDWFPMIFAAIVLLGFWAGFNIDRLSALVPAGVGITLYGAAYALVHDVYIHRRIALFRRPVAPLERLAEAHRIHHLYNAAPYGMLAPIVPAELRRRAAQTDRNPFPAREIVATS